MKDRSFLKKISLFIHKCRYAILCFFFKVYQISKGCLPKANSMYFHCMNHYGDHVQNMVYLNSLARENHGKVIYYGINNAHISQIKEFTMYENLKVVKIGKISFNSIDLWKNRFLYWSYSPIRHLYYDFYMVFFGHISDKINIVNPLNSKRDLLTDVTFKPDKYSEFDILVVNSIPLSSQFNYSEKDFTRIILILSKKHKIITTHKVSGVDCTADTNMTLKEIGELSLFCKIVISISTGPSWAVLNKENFNSEKPVLILHGGTEIVDFNSHSEAASSLDKIIPFVDKFI
jgi:hypothetical protein